MLNVAEEVREPERTLPRAMVAALLCVALLYLAISITAVSAVPFRDLGDPDRGAPFVQITARTAPWLPGWVFQSVTLFAVANTALINFIMASRLAYGLARQGLLPAPLGAVHPGRHTPPVAILTVAALVVVLALSAELSQLAAATSLLLLTSFSVVNVAILLLQRRPGEPRGRFEVPAVVPLLGTAVCLALLIARARTGAPALWIALGILAGIALLYRVLRPAGFVPDPADDHGSNTPPAG